MVVSETKTPPTRLDVKTLLRGPVGNDPELLAIFLKYNDVLLKRGIGTFNIWMKRAHYLHGLGRYEDAIQAVQEALLHEPHSSDAHFLMGVCFQLLALDEAGGDFDEPLTEEVHSLLESAALAFEATLELNPGDEEAGMYLTNIRCLIYSPNSAGASAKEGGYSGQSDVVPVV